MHICLKSHLCYTTVIAVYAPTNPISSTSGANQPLEDFYNELHSVLATIPPIDMIVISGDFNSCVELTPTPGIQSLACMGWVKSTRVGNVCLISPTFQFNFQCHQQTLQYQYLDWHKSKHQCTWYQNGDYVLVSTKYRSSSLDTHGVYHHSDHELVVSTLCFKIKTKQCQYHHSCSRQTKCLARDIVSTYRTSLAVA